MDGFQERSSICPQGFVNVLPTSQIRTLRPTHDQYKVSSQQNAASLDAILSPHNHPDLMRHGNY